MRNRRGIIAPSGGGTFEWTNFKEQMQGVIIPPLLMILSRGCLLAGGIVAVLVMGEQAPAIILAVVAFWMWLGAKTGNAVCVDHVPFILVVCVVLTGLSVAGYWPKTLTWTHIDGRMHYHLLWTFKSRWLSWVSVDTGIVPVTPLVMWTRWIVTFIAPVIVANPFRFADWALGIETLWTNARNLRFGAADPESIPGTQGFGVKAARGRSGEQEDDGGGIVSVPAPDIVGS